MGKVRQCDTYVVLSQSSVVLESTASVKESALTAPETNPQQNVKIHIQLTSYTQKRSVNQ